MKTKAYSYLRFSTADQARGDSERRQIELGRKWCDANRMEFAENYRDLGISAYRGTNSEKGHLALFLAKVRAGDIEKGSVLVVESLDRLSRQSVVTALGTFLEIINAGVGIVTLTDGRHYSREKLTDNYTDLIVSLTIMARANEESKTKSNRIGEAWRAKRKRLGSEKMTAVTVGWLRLSEDRKQFVAIPERAKVIREIFDAAAAGAGANSIAKDLNKRKVPTFGKAKFWNLSYIKKILVNRAVIGEFSPATKASGKRQFLGQVVEDYYPAVVPLATFHKVTALRAARPSYRGKSGFNIFSHLVFDRATGCAMTYVNKNREKGWHYLVPSHALSGNAKYTAWQYDNFKEAVLAVFKDASRRRITPRVPKNDRAAELQAEMEELKAKIARLVNYLADGASDAVEGKLRALEAERDKVAQALKVADSQKHVEKVKLAAIDWDDNEALKENLRATVKRITVDAQEKSFVIETIDGRQFGYMERDGKVAFTAN